MTSEEHMRAAPGPSRLERAARSLGHALPDMPLRKPLASLALRLAGGKSGKAFDMAVFETERARLHPFDNISEKRVFITPRFWERPEREALAARIRAHEGDSLVFLDVGSNAGLYTLYVQALCKKRGIALRPIMVEPDPEMRRRLGVNLDLSGIRAQVFGCAVADAPGRLTLSLHARNRGENSLVTGDGEGIEVEVRTLASLLEDAGAERVDIMKIDIEGAELRALKGLFEGAPRALWPSYVQIEAVPGGRNADALTYLSEKGYALIGSTEGNSFLAR